MKMDATIYYHKVLDGLYRKKKGLNQSDFKKAQEETSKYIKNSKGVK